ncbi:MAG: NUDIX hydrolase [Cyanobacteria bacterium SZAS-4]|nr:NUDIX hydrolase [Cyanobacteria bacterium SZAS-4]
MNGYISELRKTVGNRPLIVTGACVFIENADGHILLQGRTDNGTWGLPGGSLELDESLEDCARREVLEETGLALLSLEFFAAFSGRDHVYTCPNGDVVHNVSIAFRSKDYIGKLEPDGKEGTKLKFFALDSLPAELNPNDKPMLERYCGNNR